MLVWNPSKILSTKLSVKVLIRWQDFRSSDGLYALVKQQYPDVVLKGRDLFDASLFRDPTSTSVFYTFISQLKQSIDVASPTPTHHFIKTLDTKRKLLRSYTQNIDGLEDRAGLLGSSSLDAKATKKGKSRIKTKEVKNIQLHGDIHRVRCTFCSAEYPCTEEHLKLFNRGSAPDCPECLGRCEQPFIPPPLFIWTNAISHSWSACCARGSCTQDWYTASCNRPLWRTSSSGRWDRYYPNYRPRSKTRHAYHHGHFIESPRTQEARQGLCEISSHFSEYQNKIIAVEKHKKHSWQSHFRQPHTPCRRMGRYYWLSHRWWDRCMGGQSRGRLEENETCGLGSSEDTRWRWRREPFQSCQGRVYNQTKAYVCFIRCVIL